MQRVLVLDKNREPLMPCHPARARELVRKGRASVFRRQPYTIILHDRAGGETQPTQLKIDPGSKTTGVALVADCKRGKKVVWAMELHHRGQIIKDRLLSRRQLRRGRRGRKTRYRPARFNNRRRPKGWLPPSLQSRVDNIFTWANRLYRWSPYDSISVELVRFDTHKMQNPEISGVEYQQGELQGYEVREYLLEKWGRKCAYCGAKDVPLEVEHITPRSRGGSDRVSNLTLACTPCNQTKGNQTAKEFGYPDIQRKAKQPLKDAAAVNATRWAIYNGLKGVMPVETGTGGRTKFNRIKQKYPKAHWIDAACVGESGEVVHLPKTWKALQVKAMGRGSRQKVITDKYGFPKYHKSRQKMSFGFVTGDIVKGRITRGKYKGCHRGRVTANTGGKFAIKQSWGVVQPTHKNCTLLQMADGYDYVVGDK